jgi:hypothetical protein
VRKQSTLPSVALFQRLGYRVVNSAFIDRPFGRNRDRALGFAGKPIYDHARIQKLEKIDHQRNMLIPAKQPNLARIVKLLQNGALDDVQVMQLDAIDIKSVEQTRRGEHRFSAFSRNTEDEMGTNKSSQFLATAWGR